MPPRSYSPSTGISAPDCAASSPMPSHIGVSTGPGMTALTRLQRREMGQAGIVDRAVHRAETGGCGDDDLLGRSRPGDVGGDDLDAAVATSGQLAQRGLAAPDHDHVRAPDQAPADGATHPCAGPCDDHRPSGHPIAALSHGGHPCQAAQRCTRPRSRSHLPVTDALPASESGGTLGACEHDLRLGQTVHPGTSLAPAELTWIDGDRTAPEVFTAAACEDASTERLLAYMDRGSRTEGVVDERTHGWPPRLHPRTRPHRSGRVRRQ